MGLESYSTELKAVIKDMNNERVEQAKHRERIDGKVKVIVAKVDAFIETTHRDHTKNMETVQKEIIDCRSSRGKLYDKIGVVDDKIDKAESKALKALIGILLAIAGSIIGVLKIK